MDTHHTRKALRMYVLCIGRALEAKNSAQNRQPLQAVTVSPDTDKLRCHCCCCCCLLGIALGSQPQTLASFLHLHEQPGPVLDRLVSAGVEHPPQLFPSPSQVHALRTHLFQQRQGPLVLLGLSARLETKIAPKTKIKQK